MGGVDVVSVALSRHGYDSAIVAEGLQVLERPDISAGLCCSRASQRRALQPLMEFANAQALSVLTASDIGQSLSLQYGIVESVVRAMGQHMPVEAVQRAGCETLHVLVQREHCRAQAMAAGVLSALVAAMSSHELVEDVQQSATAAINTLVATNAQRSGFAASGAVQAVRGRKQRDCPRLTQHAQAMRSLVELDRAPFIFEHVLTTSSRCSLTGHQCHEKSALDCAPHDSGRTGIALVCTGQGLSGEGAALATGHVVHTH